MIYLGVSGRVLSPQMMPRGASLSNRFEPEIWVVFPVPCAKYHDYANWFKNEPALGHTKNARAYISYIHITYMMYVYTLARLYMHASAHKLSL